MYRRPAFAFLESALVANVLRNPRVAEGVNERTDAFFTEEAMVRSHQSFARFVAQWERLVDQDGTLDDAEHTHARRRASLTHEFDGGYRLELRGGALHGADWQHGGPTAPWNGEPRCGYHNRLKNAGFITRHAADGSATHRPDGTPITAAV